MTSSDPLSFDPGWCSIIIPIFNRQETLRETIESCLSQDYPSVELVLVDDGSTDNSNTICAAFVAERQSPQRRLVFVSQANAGACVARNRGLDLARGEFILFLDSDDTIPPNKLSRHIFSMQIEHADCSICDFVTIDSKGNEIAVHRNNFELREFITRLKSPFNSAIVMRRASIPRSLRWNVALSRMQDFDFMLRYLAGVPSFVYLPEPLCNYRIHQGARISDTYPQGMPYMEMFRSMNRHLAALQPQTEGRLVLLSLFGAALVRSHLRDTASRLLPRFAKRTVKSMLRVVSARGDGSS